MWLRTALSSLTPGIGAPLGQLKKTLAQVGLACEGLQVDRWGRCRNQDQRVGCTRNPQSPQLPQAKGDWDRSDWIPPSLQVACSPRRWPVLFQSPSLWPVLPVWRHAAVGCWEVCAALELRP